MLASGLPDDFADREPLARFLTSSSHFNAIAVKPAAFMPNRARETSVFRHERDPVEGLRLIAEKNLAVSCSCYGAAICEASAVRKVGLEISASEPPARHANIVGWPAIENDPVAQKSKDKELAASVASASALVRFGS